MSYQTNCRFNKRVKNKLCKTIHINYLCVSLFEERATAKKKYIDPVYIIIRSISYASAVNGGL